MKYFALLTPSPGKTADDFLPLRLLEERRVWQLYCADVIREMHFQPEPLRVALQFECDRADTVHLHLATLPMVAEGLFEVDLMQMGPWLPFAALFSPESSGVQV
ncbi:hypothetical protein FVA81_02195 (plasmid) [Rhizobium sp. WL3]|uniref:hypothetical protein n=1 Tax=Rhizobium sp. WL3 TaxID=2603277 RepID=UPI0011C1E3B0|nr:hypothetical protein [Rhizobium sp. WL3]QEE43474.1 hypothetical protein FVA81_02195 [Rhizobium sp. WL3]